MLRGLFCQRLLMLAFLAGNSNQQICPSLFECLLRLNLFVTELPGKRTHAAEDEDQ